MCPAACESFGSRWARDNLNRTVSQEELRVLNTFPLTCNGDEPEAARRARRYYAARSRGGMELWHHRRPDDEDILSSCQDAYIVPLRVRSVGGRQLTLVRLPAPLALDRPLSVNALIARWLMILDIRVREEMEPVEEVMLVDVCDLQTSHFKHFLVGNYWKEFFNCIRSAHPKKFSEIHIVNTHRIRLKTLFLLRAGLYPWKRKITHIHSRTDELNKLLGSDYFPIEGLPLEYGGKAGALKDLNDEWTKKLLSNAKWLQTEETKFYSTELKPMHEKPNRGLNDVRIPGLRNSRRGTYHVLRRSKSEKILSEDDVDEGAYGNYRTLKVASDHGFYG